MRLAALKPRQLRVGYVFLQSIELHVLVRLLLLLSTAHQGGEGSFDEVEFAESCAALVQHQKLLSFSSTPVPVSTPLCQVATGR